MQLEEYIRKTLGNKNILLMTHIVLGYPSLDINREVIRQMAENGVDPTWKIDKKYNTKVRRSITRR